MRVCPALAILMLACGSPSSSLPPHKIASPSKLSALGFGERSPVPVAAGSMHQFRLVDDQEPARGLRVAWSVTPNDGHVALAKDGLFVVNESAAEGATYEIVAHVNDGARILRQQAMIFHPGANPFLLDVWRETADIDCEGVVRPSSDPQPLLRFFADGTFFYDRGTLPPDAHVAPQGRYSFDEATKKITFTSGNRVINGMYELTRVGPRKSVPWLGAYYQPSKLVLRGIPFENTSRREPCAREFRANPFVR